uniref:Solute carrier family 37 (glycerol-3-phosphate transporter), member 1 n=1 Tax=Mus musculus TaxID=10090 RepID=A0A494B977_MOUSE
MALLPVGIRFIISFSRDQWASFTSSVLQEMGLSLHSVTLAAAPGMAPPTGS